MLCDRIWHVGESRASLVGPSQQTAATRRPEDTVESARNEARWSHAPFDCRRRSHGMESGRYQWVSLQDCSRQDLSVIFPSPGFAKNRTGANIFADRKSRRTSVPTAPLRPVLFGRNKSTHTGAPRTQTAAAQENHRAKVVHGVAKVTASAAVEVSRPPLN